MTAVHLSERDSELFLLFRKHQELFSAILESGAHEMRRGEATLRFGADGTLMEIELRQTAYRRKSREGTQ